MSRKVAEPAYWRAGDRRGVWPDHLLVATDLNNLALLLQATNRLTEAEPLYRGGEARRRDRSAKNIPKSPPPSRI